MGHEKTYNLLFSKGTPLINRLLKQHIKTLPTTEGLFVSKKLLAAINKKNKELISSDIPSNLQLAYIRPEVNQGIFLKAEEKCIEIGTFIGIYTGLYELIGLKQGQRSYSYDIAKGISLTKSQLNQTRLVLDNCNNEETYCIQTNALEMGNFTRFINHSPLEPNIRAVLSKFPNGRIEILLFAQKKIQPGEQLLSNYGDKYWKDLQISPIDMTPTTYTLNSLGKVVSSNEPVTNVLKNSDSHLSEELSFKLGLLKFGYW